MLASARYPAGEGAAPRHSSPSGSTGWKLWTPWTVRVPAGAGVSAREEPVAELPVVVVLQNHPATRACQISGERLPQLAPPGRIA
nr:hypothetical protein [Streptomyces sp. GESEQ-35]